MVSTFIPTFCAYLLPQGLRVVTTATMLHSVKVLSLSNKSLSLNAVLNVMKCFPCLEMLNIQVSTVFICINYFVTQYYIKYLFNSRLSLFYVYLAFSDIIQREEKCVG